MQKVRGIPHVPRQSVFCRACVIPREFSGKVSIAYSMVVSAGIGRLKKEAMALTEWRVHFVIRSNS